MVKQAQGFLASDGTFFTDEGGAERYEAEQILVDTLTEQGIDPEKFLKLVDEHHAKVTRYIEATTADVRDTRKGNGVRTKPDTVKGDTSDVGRGKADTETVQ